MSELEPENTEDEATEAGQAEDDGGDTEAEGAGTAYNASVKIEEND